MEDSTVIIEKILKAKKIEDVLNPSNMKKEFFALMMKIHPDHCTSADANNATAKLNQLKELFELGAQYVDESGTFRVHGTYAEYEGDISLLRQSLANWKKLTRFNDAAANQFKKYMPSNMEILNGKLRVTFAERAVPLSGHTFEQKHVNWILSRMMEFSAWLSQVGYVHCSLNPESVYVMPENHGIQVASFYMLSDLNSRVTGISGKYKHWYPPQLFSTKKATSEVDMELCMKTAISLLGDKSGSGVKLRRDPNVNKEFLDFVLVQHAQPGPAFKEYRDLLARNFKKEFHVLDI